MSEAFIDDIAPPQDPHECLNLEPITREELLVARLTPRVILERMLYADVRTRVAAGGVGKTTLALFEAANLALGRELWGRKPSGTVKTCLVTREDPREALVARLREVCRAMNLSQSEIDQVLYHVTVLDLSGETYRLSMVLDDVVIPARGNIEPLCERLESWRVDWLIFDPLVSFGVGESRVNDAEQGLIEAFRLFRNRLNCCVEGIHHTGKQNARDKIEDQYAGRGGSALADGSRMVAVLNPLSPEEFLQKTGRGLQDGETGLVMALPKLSHAPPQQPIIIRRYGYLFEQVEAGEVDHQAIADDRANTLLAFIRAEYEHGRKYANADLENMRERLQMSRNEIRQAVTDLKVTGRVVYHTVKGKSGSHFEPIGSDEKPF